MDTQKEITIRIIFIAAALLFITASYFIYSFIKQQRKVMAWQKLRIHAEIESIENERKRIAGDLHDELGPILSAVRLQINHLEPTDETEQAALQKSTMQIDEVIKRFREISYDLLPNTLVRKGLIKAVEEFANRMSETSKLKIELTLDSIKMEPLKEINFYRIIQEIIHNTVKHARAGVLHIEIKEINKLIYLHTKDDGIGFNYQEKSAAGGGLGLLNLQSRVEVLNGQLKVSSSPGKGTSFSIEIPSEQ